MPTFKLNGQDIPFEKGDTIMRAAWRAGVEIPHYCWHPGLSVAANCRMCLVHIKSGRQAMMPIMKFDAAKAAYVPDTKPKLTPACQAAAAAGMEVDSIGPEVENAQAHVQEFLLLNHPVDCPICDQAGECKLQDYYETHQATAKRKRTEPVHKPKGVRFGPTIVYDAERCIMCTRCIRVSDELANDHVLDMRERGNRNEIVLAPGRELDHKYSLMTEHVCPVGALTSRDFRFRARVWFLKSVEGVCTGCATGCNTHVDFDPRYGKVYRLRPRDNMACNQYWMCDDGMMTYTEIHENRVVEGRVGRGEDCEPVPVEDALLDAAQQIAAVKDRSKIAVVLSAQHATEDNFALAQLAEKLGTERLYMAALGGWEGDEILRHQDNNPNRNGVSQVAGGAIDDSVEDLIEDVLAGEVQAVIALGWATAATLEQVRGLEKLDCVISLTSNEGPLAEVASVVIPVASWAEMFGSFTNAKGVTQHFGRAISPPHGVQPAWRTLVRLSEELGVALPYARTGDVRKAMAPPTPTATASAVAPAP